MGLLNLFKASKNSSLPPLPSGSYTVDRDGKVVTRTISIDELPAVLAVVREEPQAAGVDGEEGRHELGGAARLRGDREHQQHRAQGDQKQPCVCVQS